MSSPSLSVKIQIIGGKVCWAISTNIKSLLTTPSNDFPLHLKQTFPPIIWIFTEGEGGGIKSRILFKIFSTLSKSVWSYCVFRSSYLSYSYLDSVTTLCAMCSLFEDSRSINSKFSSAVIMSSAIRSLLKLYE